MIPSFRHPWGWAALAPIACAIHCAALPVTVAVLPNIAGTKTVEAVLLGATALIAAVALGSGVRRHRQWWIFAPVGAGLLVWSASLGHAFAPLPETLTNAGSALVVAAGLLWNSRLHCLHGASVPAGGLGCPGCEEDRNEATATGTPPTTKKASEFAA